MKADLQVLEEFLDHYDLEMSIEDIEAVKCIKIEAIMCDWRVIYTGGSVDMNLNFQKPGIYYSIMGIDAECTEYGVADMSTDAIINRMTGRVNRRPQSDKLFIGTRIECIEYFRKTLL